MTSFGNPLNLSQSNKQYYVTKRNFTHSLTQELGQIVVVFVVLLIRTKMVKTIFYFNQKFYTGCLKSPTGGGGVTNIFIHKNLRGGLKFLMNENC